MSSTYRKVSYGEHISEFFHVYLPKQQRKDAKLFFVVHGGYWQAPYKLGLMGRICKRLVKQGHAVINVEYPKVGEEGDINCISIHQSIFNAFDLAQKLHPGLETIAIGHSAGGDFVLKLASRNNLPDDLAPVKPYNIPDVVVALAPVTDLLAGKDTLSDSKVAIPNFVGLNLSEAPIDDDYRKFSSINYEPGCVTFLFHGWKDKVVPLEYSERYHEKWKHTERVLIFKPKVDHMGVISPSKPMWDELLGMVG